MLNSIKFAVCIIFLSLSCSTFAQNWVQRHPLKSLSDIAEMHISADQSIFVLDASTTLKKKFF